MERRAQHAFARQILRAGPAHLLLSPLLDEREPLHILRHLQARRQFQGALPAGNLSGTTRYDSDLRPTCCGSSSGSFCASSCSRSLRVNVGSACAVHHEVAFGAGSGRVEDVCEPALCRSFLSAEGARSPPPPRPTHPRTPSPSHSAASFLPWRSDFRGRDQPYRRRHHHHCDCRSPLGSQPGNVSPCPSALRAAPRPPSPTVLGSGS